MHMLLEWTHGNRKYLGKRNKEEQLSHESYVYHNQLPCLQVFLVYRLYFISEPETWVFSTPFVDNI